MNSTRATLLTLCIAATFAATDARAERETDPLAPILECVKQGKFAVSDIQRVPETTHSRTVETSVGALPVSLADGYRMMLSTDQGEPFVNLKIELSVPANSLGDRVAVIGQMKSFAGVPEIGKPALVTKMVDGVEVFSLSQFDIEPKHKMLSLYSMLAHERNVIATLYVMNQKQEKRAFSTMAEFQALRDQAAGLVTGCLAVPKSN